MIDIFLFKGFAGINYIKRQNNRKCVEQSIKRISDLTEQMSNVISSVIQNKLDKDIVLDDFKKDKQKHFENLISNSLSELVKESATLSVHIQKYKDIAKIQELINTLVNNKKKYNSNELLEILKELRAILPKNDLPKDEFSMKNIPDTIRNEVIADLDEAKRCYDNSCYRSATILCGRILETCLHRKYYEMTNKDILETCPDMGLGKLIAKLSELRVKLDPGLTEQIHLINKVRIGSVHIKQETFLPSKSQAQAMLLYTQDVINKLFV
jgi:hypothetical protein